MQMGYTSMVSGKWYSRFVSYVDLSSSPSFFSSFPLSTFVYRYFQSSIVTVSPAFRGFPVLPYLPYLYFCSCMVSFSHLKIRDMWTLIKRGREETAREVEVGGRKGSRNIKMAHVPYWGGCFLFFANRKTTKKSRLRAYTQYIHSPFPATSKAS